MITVEGENADAVWRNLSKYVAATGVVQESRDQPTRELLHVAFTITDPRQRVVFARPINPALAVAEVIWILAGANDSRFLSFWNPRMSRFTDANMIPLHGAYGFRLGSQPALPDWLAAQLRLATPPTESRVDQLKAAYEALRHTPHSRQVVLQIWDPKRDLPNPSPRSRDVPCNLLSHLLIRNGRLEWLQVMRSNDLVWGLPYNLIQFTVLQEIMAGWLGSELGSYNQISDSLHVYQRHWGNLDHNLAAPVPLNRADLRLGPYEQWEAMWSTLVAGAWELTQQQAPEALLAIAKRLEGLPPAYREWIVLLTAEALRRHEYWTLAEETITGAGPFWETSWRQWLASKMGGPDTHTNHHQTP